MADNYYLYAVAVVRANEAALLKEQDLEQIIGAPDYKKAVAVLCDKGYDEPNGSDYSSMLDAQLERTWNLLKENAPEAEELNALIVRNDFQNLKACLKSEITGQDPKEFFVSPCVIEHDFLVQCIGERKFSELPQFIAEAAEKAFDTVTKTGNGQLCDVIIDSATLKAMQFFAAKSEEASLKEYVDMFCAVTDIKTAVRAARTKKGSAFVDAALVETAGIDKAALSQAALDSESAVLDYLSENDMAGYRTALEKGDSAFEKYCDDKLVSVIRAAKYTSLGVAPLAAYYIAKETEIKALRIILSAKISGASNDTVRERLRELYV